MLIDVKPEVEAELSRQAAAYGIDLGAYLASLLEEGARRMAATKKAPQSEISRPPGASAMYSKPGENCRMT